MKKRHYFIAFFPITFLLGFGILFSIEKQGKIYAGAENRLSAWAVHQKMERESIFKNLRWRCVGPQFQAGRISSIAVPAGDRTTIYAAAGSGNLWKTVNNGTTWESIFDHESTHAIGDICISKSNSKIVWVGSGEELMARSSYAGTGVFKSEDGGRTWNNMGLHDTHHIGRIVIDPQNPDIVYVAAIGHMYTYNEERGLFKTVDGGKSWNKILSISEKAGVVEVVMDPADNKTLYAASWERDRKPWINVQSGAGSGIYKTTDAGARWKKLAHGFPSGEHVGRIGLSVSASNPDIVYALLDNHALRTEESKESEKDLPSALTIPRLEKMTNEDFLKTDPKVIGAFLKGVRVPKEYTADVILGMMKKGNLSTKSFAQYLLDLWPDRRQQFINVIGAEIYRSDNKGETWKKVNESHLDSFFNNFGYAFCDIRVSPENENKVYILGIRFLTSDDGGKSFYQIGGKNVHADHHDLWIDPENPKRLLLGNDGGFNISYDRGITWLRHSLPIGEFYAVSVDMKTPYMIYGGLQDTGVFMGPGSLEVEFGVDDPWKRISGGDGFFTWADPTDFETIYYGLQFGSFYRKNLKDGTSTYITPQAKIGEPPLRYNWMTPFVLSSHNPSQLYYGASRLYKSLNRGDDWTCISPDLTTNPGPEMQGDIPFGTITAISESPIRPQLIYVGTDDGQVHVTQNDGASWTDIGGPLPKKWVSRVVASRYEDGTVFVSLTGFREDDFEKYLFMSTDHGRSWKSIASNLPSEPINVIREDPKSKNILYVGSDLGAYVSLDRGTTWHSLGHHLPTIPVYDLVVHPRTDELVIGTHGRSVFTLDVRPIQTFHEGIAALDAHLFKTRPARLPQSRGDRGEWAQEKKRDAHIIYYLGRPQDVNVFIQDENGKIIKTLKATTDKGFNLAVWDLTFDGGKEIGQGFASAGNYVGPGRYTVVLSVSGRRIEETVWARSADQFRE